MFVYTVNQDSRGFIWAGTGEGIFRFDGFTFTGGLVTDSLSNGVASVSYRDEKGTLWFGYQGGNIKYDGKTFNMYYGEYKKLCNRYHDPERRDYSLQYAEQRRISP